MSKPKRRKKTPAKRVLALPDLERAKTAVLNSLTSAVNALMSTSSGNLLPSSCGVLIRHRTPLDTAPGVRAVDFALALPVVHFRRTGGEF